MAMRNLYDDSSTQASGELDYMLRKPKEEAFSTESVDDAMHASRLAKHTSDRDVTRVLFISKNTALLNPSQQTLDGYINVSDMFDEVHIVVMRIGLPPRQPVLRPDKNVWIYTVAATYWWQLPAAAKLVLEKELKFATGFRPDLIVARDPLESGLVALRAAKDYGRPAQLHVTKSTYDREVSIRFLYQLLARYTIPRFKSVRVTNKMIWNKISSIVTATDFSILPRLNPYQSILQSQTKIDLHKKYPQYIFSMMFVGQLEEGSSVLEVINAAAQVLQNSSVVLFIIGDGPLLSDCKSRAKALGIEEQIVYLPSTVNVPQYLKSAHVLFITDTDEFSEDIMLQAAYAQVPMLLSKTEHRLDIFSHLESAYFCEPHEIELLTTGLSALMNDVELRKQMADQALMAAQDYFHQDPTLFQRKYRASVEGAMFIEGN
jgi:glycosyltransferase involved in cell wall biosynthesis